MTVLVEVRPAAGTLRMREESDLGLVSQVKAGDVEAFSELVRRHEHAVFRLAYRFMREVPGAQDMTQEAFLRAFRLLNSFRGDCQLATWLYRITCNVCLTELARRKHRGEVALEMLRTGNGTPGRVDPDRAIVLERIRRCVAKLPKRYATVVALHYFEGASYEEIAAAMRIPLGTLKTWMHRARLRLKTLVQEELTPDEIDLLGQT